MEISTLELKLNEVNEEKESVKRHGKKNEDGKK